MVVLDIYKGQDGNYYGWMAVPMNEASEPVRLDHGALTSARDDLLAQLVKADAALLATAAPPPNS